MICDERSRGAADQNAQRALIDADFDSWELCFSLCELGDRRTQRACVRVHDDLFYLDFAAVRAGDGVIFSWSDELRMLIETSVGHSRRFFTPRAVSDALTC